MSTPTTSPAPHVSCNQRAFVLFLMCQALYYFCQEEMNDLDANRKGYTSFILQVDHTWGGGHVWVMISRGR